MLLNALLFLPLIGFLITLFLPKENADGIRKFALGFSGLLFLLSLGLIGQVLATPGEYVHVTDLEWMSLPKIRYHIGVDGVSLWLVILTTLLTPLAILISFESIGSRIKEYYAFLLLLEFGLIGVFVSLDLFLFYVFWEVSLIPMYFLIGIWGHARRIFAAVKFFIFTMTGSVLMLVSIIYLYLKVDTFDSVVILQQLQSGALRLSSTEGLWLFLAFFAAFAIKASLFPLHSWLPDTYSEAPIAGTVMLAAVMAKMGTYGLVRFCLPLFPNAARECASWIAALAVIGIIYGALIALIQPNMKRLVAYSSISHLGFVILGAFSFNQVGLDGAVYQMINHGISTGALFMLVGMLYERRGSLEIQDYGGVATPAPRLAAVFLIVTLASVGLPTLNNFIGEFLVLQGAAMANFSWAVFAAVGVILSACYMLWLYQRLFLGRATEEVAQRMPDLRSREWVALAPLLVLMVWMGIYAQTFLPSISASNARILEQTKVNVDFMVQTPQQTEVADAR